jgi:hypothetical protein
MPDRGSTDIYVSAWLSQRNPRMRGKRGVGLIELVLLLSLFGALSMFVTGLVLTQNERVMESAHR